MEYSKCASLKRNMKKTILFLFLFPLMLNVYADGIYETFEIADQDSFTGSAILHWIGDISDFKITSATWPSSPTPDFFDKHSLRAKSGNVLNSTIITDISSFYLPAVRTRWEVFVSGGSTKITLSKGFSIILFVNSGNTASIESGSVNGYRLRLCDPSGTGFPDGLYFEKASGSGWIMIDSVHTGDAKINQGWTLAVERDSDGNWFWGYSNGTYNANVDLTENISDNDFTSGSYTGMNWYSIASSAGSFGFDNFKVDPYTPGMWRETSSSSEWANAENWEDGLVPVSSTNVQIVNSNNHPVVNADVSCNHLTILPNASLTINLGKTLYVNGDFLIQSNSNGDGSLVDKGSLTINGSSGIQRYLAYYGSGVNEFHFLSSPIANHNVENTLQDCYVYPYNEADNTWLSLNNGDALNTGRGYSVYYSGNENYTVTFSGIPNTGNQNIAVSASDFSGNNSNDNWNLIGNPFPSAIDWDEIIKTNIESAIYIWNPASLTYASYVNGVGSNMNDEGIIPSMQAFFVHATASGNFNIPQSVRINNQTQNYLKKASSDHQVLKITASRNGFKDETIIRLMPETTANFDLKYDAYKFLYETDSAIQVYSLTKDDQKLSVNSIPILNMPEEIQLGLLLATADSISLSFEGIQDFKSSINIFLEDQTQQQTIELLTDTTLTYYFLPGEENRFILHLASQMNGFYQPRLKSPRIWLNRNNINISFLNTKPQDVFARIFDLSGRLIHSEFIANTNNLQLNKPKKYGIYFIQLEIQHKIYNYKILIDR